MGLSHILYFSNNKWTHNMMTFFTLSKITLLAERQLQMRPGDFSGRYLTWAPAIVITVLKNTDLTYNGAF